MSTPSSSNYWSYIKDGLTLLVVPLLMWGIRLETTIAVQKETVSRLEKKVEENETAMKTIEDTVQANSIQLVKLDSKMDSMAEKVDDIKELLQRERP
tara:strand:+ start:529 stop:819 length:291 start_codon:yes stop_codon:yes gene_type:complete